MTTTKHIKRTPEPFTDTDGTECIRLPLRVDGQFALLDLEDAAAWADAGLSWQWGLDHSGYVVANVAGKGQTVIARLLLAARAGERVVYNDGNRRNLRRLNLRIMQKGAAVSAVNAFQQKQAAHRKATDGAQEVQP